MTPSLLIRPVLAIALAASLSACGMIDSDPNRFENLAERVASVPLDGSEAPRTVAAAPAARAGEGGLRPALKVEVLDPHALWDARDGVAQTAAPAVSDAVIRTAAPAITDAVVREASDRIRSVTPAQLRPALRPAVQERDGLVQLGAYSSEAAAVAAWNRLKAGPAAWALEGLNPVYEPVAVNGRTLVRLKVRAPASGAGAICAAAGVDDPWCRRTA